MGDAKGVPDDNVRIFNALVAVHFDPLGEASGWISGCLRDVSTGGIYLIILVWQRLLIHGRIWEM